MTRPGSSPPGGSNLGSREPGEVVNGPQIDEENEVSLVLLHSRKLTQTLTSWPPGRVFSSTNQWFSGSMLVFQGVCSTLPRPGSG